MTTDRGSGKRTNHPVRRVKGAPRRTIAPATSPKRRADRSQRSRSAGWQAWTGITIVVVVILAFAIYKLTSSPGVPKNDNTSLVPASVVSELASIPASTLNAVGTDESADPFTETAKQAFLTLDGKPQVVYVGAEYCPYCALYRWALVVAMSRFGSFTHLHETTSSFDYAPIPTFSFVGARYSSKYIAFTPYEEADRNGHPLEVPPPYISALYKKYDGTGTTPTKFTGASSPGIPFVDVANRHVSSGAPAILLPSIPDVAGGGPGGFNGIAYAIAHPDSPTGKAIDARAFIAAAIYDMAAICTVDRQQPSSVSQMPCVKAAEREMAAKKTVA
jgi:thiol-disulfide isomerase/thioredoxin